MFKVYLMKFIFRVAVFSAALWVYLTNKAGITSILGFHIFQPVGVVYLLWILLMGGMVLQILPHDRFVRITMGSRKQFARTFTPPTGPYDELGLFRYVSKVNIAAWKILLIWLSFNAVFGVLYLLNVIGAEELILISMLFYVFDLVCVLFFCPFQRFYMKNRCCVNCRIFNWGHFMMYTPLLFVKSFFSWSLFFASVVVLIRWEILYAHHPERFWEGSNTTLQCENCKDKICRLKKPLKMPE